MAFRMRRQSRYVSLRKSGFLPFEASTLSKVPRSLPYMRLFIKERQGMLAQSISDKKSNNDYIADIKKIYTDNAYTRDKRGKIYLDPWQLLRRFEDDYIKKHPEYQSPWAKRRVKWMNFVDKAEKSIRKMEEKRDQQARK